jgi:predicted Zn finger-like uncharacterized protein
VVRRPFAEGTADTGGHDMRISCRHCGEPYDIDERSLPRFGASVRCPACGGLFDLPARSAEAVRRAAGRLESPAPASLSRPPLPLRPVVPAAPVATPEDEAADADELPEGSHPEEETDSVDRREASPTAVEDAAPELDAGEPEMKEGAAATEAPPAEVPESVGPASPPDPGEVARRIVSALAERHAATLDRAIEGGALLAALGVEIAAAWEAFLAEAGESERASRTFQDALNDRFFGGRPVF